MTDSTIMARLKEETWPQHQEAEQQELERRLVAGDLPREAYIEYLAQRYLAHQYLEKELRALRDEQPRLAELITDQRTHEHRAAGDVRFLGGNPDDTEPLPATRALIDDIAAARAKNPVSLLGFFYVFEGSTNGARFIARAIRKSYDLDTDGTVYLDPYGEEQRPLWMHFRAEMEKLELTEEEQTAIIDAARITFTRIKETGQQICEKFGIPV